MKRHVGDIEPVPTKRVFYSIIADYDVNRSICELVDNAIDEWVRGGRTHPLEVRIELDPDQQSIEIQDNAGGVARDEIEILVGPGYSSNSGEGSTIGYFGVGTKRAVVALAQQISMRTCRADGPTHQVEYDDAWLETDSWRLPVFEVAPIPGGTTIITLSRLRHVISDELIENLRVHLGATYAIFVKGGNFSLLVNKQEVTAVEFEAWAYPPDFPPMRFHGDLHLAHGKVVAVEALVGLTNVSSPATGEYGLYLYCNNRLIVRGLKSHHVGFDKGNIGVPHPDLSLVRAIVRLRGETKDMPWNSSKAGINYSHHVFTSLRPWLISAMKEYATVSRRLAGQWETAVFAHKEGRPREVFIPDFPTAKKNYLPNLPSRAAPSVSLKAMNKNIVEERPWTRGLIGGLSAVRHLDKGKLGDGNRVALIVLDSMLEIAFKEYLVNEVTGSYYSNEELRRIFNARNLVHDEVKKHVPMTRNFWQKVRYYYDLRCKLVHERSTVAIADDDIEDFRQLIEQALGKLFELKIPK